MSRELAVAIDAVRIGGDILKKYLEMGPLLPSHIKEDGSLVTEADERSEDAIRDVIKATFPHHRVIAEETGAHGKRSKYRWHIDPLDGTVNFARNFVEFAVSVALEKEGKIIVAAVYNPVLRLLFYAERGQGAFYNNEDKEGIKMQVSSREASDAMVTIAKGRAKDDREHTYKLFAGLHSRFPHVRYLGASALELAYVAQGVIDGCITLGTKTWDYAAGSLLIEEAGGALSDFDGNKWELSNNHFIASNGVIHDELIAELKELSD